MTETWQGIDGCVRRTNGEVDVVLATTFGPRVLRYGRVGGDDVFGEHPALETPTEWGPWRVRGGHRLWGRPRRCRAAPEMACVG